MVGLLVIVIVMYLGLFGFGFISYAFNSYGLYGMAKRENENTIMPWIPYINKYTLGRIAFKSNVHAAIMVTLAVINVIISMAIFFVARNLKLLYFLIILGFIISIILSVYCFVAHYRIYKKYSKSTVIMTVLDVLSLGLLGPFFIFAIKDNDEN